MVLVYGGFVSDNVHLGDVHTLVCAVCACLFALLIPMTGETGPLWTDPAALGAARDAR